jgi:tetratricopeptide (TPR) repeat protein
MARNSLGIINAEAGDIGKALEYFNGAISADGENPMFRMNKANACMGLGKTEEAMREYDAAERLDPDNMDVYYNRAAARQKLNDLRGMAADLEKYLELNPLDSETRENLKTLKRRLA